MSRADRSGWRWRASTRTGTVMEPGEFAVRGGILDLFPPGRISPVRLDFFGDTLESIKAFDAETQRTTKPVQKLALMPISEVAFGEEAEKLFRTRYVELFGGATGDDPLYEAVSAGQRYPGQEHWLPLFHDHLETLFDYVPGAPVSFDHLAEEAVDAAASSRSPSTTRRASRRSRSAELRRAALQAGAARPHVPRRRRRGPARSRPIAVVRADAVRGGATAANVRSWRGRGGRTFAAERAAGRRQRVRRGRRATSGACRARQRRVIVAAWTPGARERLATLLADHGLKDVRKVESFAEALALPRQRRRRSPCSASSRASRRRSSPSSASRTSSATAWCGRGASARTRRRRPHRGDQPVGRRSRRARRPRHRPLRRA